MHRQRIFSLGRGRLLGAAALMVAAAAAVALVAAGPLVAAQGQGGGQGGGGGGGGGGQGGSNQPPFITISQGSCAEDGNGWVFHIIGQRFPSGTWTLSGQYDNGAGATSFNGGEGTEQGNSFHWRITLPWGPGPTITLLSVSATDGSTVVVWDGSNGADNATANKTAECGGGVVANTATIVVTKFQQQPGSEPVALSGWTISIGGVGSQTTDEGGQAIFAGLAAGEYTVCEEERPGWAFTSATGGTAVEGEPCVTVDASAGGEFQVAFTNRRLATIVVTKYQQQPGDEPRAVEGWEITVGETTQETGEDGTATFADLEPGEYTVCEEERPGWAFTSATGGTAVEGEPCVTVDASAGGEFQVAFTNRRLATIVVTKYQQQPGDEPTPVEGWQVTVGETTEETGEDGTATFADLEPGTYTVCEALPEGWRNVGATVGGSEATVTTSGGQACVTVDASAGGEFQVAFTNRRLATIVVKKYFGEPPDSSVGIVGWTVSVGDLQKTTTAPGRADFADLEPGTYTVCEELPAGWVNTGASVGAELRRPTAENGTRCVTVDATAGGTFEVAFWNRPRDGERGAVVLSSGQCVERGGEFSVRYHFLIPASWRVANGEGGTLTVWYRVGDGPVQSTTVPEQDDRNKVPDWWFEIPVGSGGPVTVVAATNGTYWWGQNGREWATVSCGAGG